MVHCVKSEDVEANQADDEGKEVDTSPQTASEDSEVSEGVDWHPQTASKGVDLNPHTANKKSEGEDPCMV